MHQQVDFIELIPAEWEVSWMLAFDVTFDAHFLRWLLDNFRSILCLCYLRLLLTLAWILCWLLGCCIEHVLCLQVYRSIWKEKSFAFKNLLPVALSTLSSFLVL